MHFEAETVCMSNDILYLILVSMQSTTIVIIRNITNSIWTGEEGGRVLPYMGYIGMCNPKEYGFSAVLDIRGVSF